MKLPGIILRGTRIKILNELMAMRRGFEDTDLKEAMNELIKRIYYEIAPRVTSGDIFTVFSDENEAGEFCRNNNLDIRGLRSVIAMMREDSLIAQGAYPVKLTQLGVEKLCI